MMRTLALLVAMGALAACGDPAGNPPMPDGPEQRPDSDNDIDFDGVPNDIDNCPTASNAYQGNEDGDRFGDACDPCPPIADDNPPDGDGDGVADACDPLPIIVGDQVLFFEGFHQGAPQGWDKAGSWSTANDQLVGSAVGDGHFALLVTDRTRETVSASITIDSIAGAASWVGLVDNKMPSASSAVACVLRPAPEIAVYDTANPGGGTTTAYEMTVGETYIMRLRRDNSTYTCSVDRAGTTAAATKQITLNNAPYQSGLTISGAGIRVNWLMVVQTL